MNYLNAYLFINSRVIKSIDQNLHNQLNDIQRNLFLKIFREKVTKKFVSN